MLAFVELDSLVCLLIVDDAYNVHDTVPAAPGSRTTERCIVITLTPIQSATELLYVPVS